MRKLRAYLKEQRQKLRQTQAALKRVRDLQVWMRKHGFKPFAKALDRRGDKLKQRARLTGQKVRQGERRLEQLKESRQGGREKFVRWLNNEVGVTEHSDRHYEYIEIVGVGGSRDWPWCSEFAAAGLIEAGGFDRDEMPSNPWYSGAWLTWDRGRRVSYSERQGGDLLIMDWGDGGMTDHIEMYVGDGQSVGGNESHPSGGVVKKDAVPSGNIVAVVRPEW